MGKANCRFSGTGAQYFPTVFIHLFLIAGITFGLYFPWAMVRLLKLKASHTLMNEKRVSFYGTGAQLFVLILIHGLLTLLTFGIYAPWALCRFFRWRAENTWVGGRQSRFVGTGGGLFLFYLIHLVILPMLTLGIYYLWGAYRLYAWKEEHTRYGGERTTFGAGFGGFLKVSLVSWIMNTITLNIFSPWSMCMLYRWQIHGLAVGDSDEVEHFPPVKANIFVILILIIIGLIPLAGLAMFVKSQYEAGVLSLKKLPQIEGISPQPKSRKIKRAIKRPSKRTHKKTPAKEAEPTFKKPEPGSIDFEREIRTINKYLKQHTGDANAYFDRGWLYAAKGDLKQAVNDYTKAVTIDKDLADAYYNRGLVYFEMKKYPLAVKDFSKTIELEPNPVDAYCELGNAYFEMGKHNLAIKNYSMGLKKGQDDADLYYNRAMAYLSLHKEKDAMKDLEKAAQMGHEKAKTYLKKMRSDAKTPTSSDKKSTISSSSAGWRQDLRNAEIPSRSASGRIHGEEFIVESARIKRGILTFRDGKKFFPDHALMFFLFLKAGERLEGKSYRVTKNNKVGAPHIHMKWKTKGKDVPETEIYMKNYVMRLEFGSKRNKRLPGKVYVCLPDPEKSFVAGSFTARVE